MKCVLLHINTAHVLMYINVSCNFTLKSMVICCSHLNTVFNFAHSKFVCLQGCFTYGTRHCWSIYYLFLFFIYQAFSKYFPCARLGGKKMARTGALPQAAARWGLGPSRGQPACRCRTEPGGGAGPAVSGRSCTLLGVGHAQFHFLLPLTSSAFHFHIIHYYLVKVFRLSSLTIPSFVFSL